MFSVVGNVYRNVETQFDSLLKKSCSYPFTVAAKTLLCTYTFVFRNVFLYLATYVPTLHPMVCFAFNSKVYCFDVWELLGERILDASLVHYTVCVSQLQGLSRFANTAELE